MSEEQIEMLKKALALYEFVVDQRNEYPESNEFFCIVKNSRRRLAFVAKDNVGRSVKLDG